LVSTCKYLNRSYISCHYPFNKKRRCLTFLLNNSIHLGVGTSEREREKIPDNIVEKGFSYNLSHFT
jgi:hypothetical protein